MADEGFWGGFGRSRMGLRVLKVSIALLSEISFWTLLRYPSFIVFSASADPQVLWLGTVLLEGVATRFQAADSCGGAK